MGYGKSRPLLRRLRKKIGRQRQAGQASGIG
jgi:hypothetical protein